MRKCLGQSREVVVCGSERPRVNVYGGETIKSQCHASSLPCTRFSLQNITHSSLCYVNVIVINPPSSNVALNPAPPCYAPTIINSPPCAVCYAQTILIRNHPNHDIQLCEGAGVGLGLGLAQLQRAVEVLQRLLVVLCMQRIGRSG